jgi:hypothetical protein
MLVDFDFKKFYNGKIEDNGAGWLPHWLAEILL